VKSLTVIVLVSSVPSPLIQVLSSKFEQPINIATEAITKQEIKNY